MVVVEVEFRVAVVSPVGATVVPVELDVVPVTMPSTVVVFSLCVSTDAAGGGVTGVVVCVVVELEEEDCAKAPPVIRATAIIAASTFSSCRIVLGSGESGDRSPCCDLYRKCWIGGSIGIYLIASMPYLCHPSLEPWSE